jgi:hypothetical protein
VGGSKGIDEYHSTNNSEILLEKHNLQIWGYQGSRLLIMGKNSTVTLSRNTAKLWALMRSSRECITHGLLELSKEQMG